MSTNRATNDSPKPKVSIIIPAYKEALCIGKTIDKLHEFLKVRKDLYGETEVIVAVGHSPDDTLKIASAKTERLSGFRVIDAGKPSHKGHNVRVGMQSARGDKRVYMDADLATPLHHLDKTLRLLDSFAVVNGVRNLSAIHGKQFHRKVMSRGCNLIVQALLLPGIKDSQCGFKGFQAATADKLFSRQRTTRWGFDVEILALARSTKSSISSLPVRDWRDMAGGIINESPLKALKASVYTFVDLLKIRYMFIVGTYKQPLKQS